jgi:hypothetical protein
MWWFIFVIPATQEAIERRIKVQGKKLRPYLKNN